MTSLLVTVRFLDDRFHGLHDRRGPPEWPPSPFRLFCALVAGVARRGQLQGAFVEALAWLQSLGPPLIIAPTSRVAVPITRHVPNNDGDHPKKFHRQERLTAKLSIATQMLLEPGEEPEVHYAWEVDGAFAAPLDCVIEAVRRLTALGWGVDMAFARASIATQAEIQGLPGIRWYPRPNAWRAEGMLRVPTFDAQLGKGTLQDLMYCHESSMSRLEHGKHLRSVDQPRVLEHVLYTSAERPIGRPWRLFALRSGDEMKGVPLRRLIHISGMVRHLAIEAMRQSPPRDVGDDWVETYVAGHAAAGAREHRQLSYLPLPSVGHVHVDPSVRRVMIVAPLGDDAWLDHVAKHLAGRVLEPLQGDEFPNGERPLLVPVRYDSIARVYTQPANAWASVTPVILPGHDDHRPDKTCKLVQKALRQSGIDQPCEFEWSAFSRVPKALPAHKYDGQGRSTGYFRPKHLLHQTAVHLRIRFENGAMVPGPMTIGSGRHCGLGLFVPEDQTG